MEKSQVILWLFIPTNKEPAKAQSPRMLPFHHPSACFEPRLPLDRLGFFPAWANVSRQAEFAQDVTHLLVVVAFVETHLLRLRLGRLRTLDDDALDGRADQFHVMTVRSKSHQADWDSMPLREQAAFHAALAAVGGIGAGFWARFGLFRIFNGENKLLADGLPPQEYAELMAFASSPRALSVAGDALLVWDDMSRPLVNKEIIAMTTGNTDEPFVPTYTP